MHEIHIAAGLREEIPRLADLQRIIDMCSSFLTIRDDYVYFIHQSVKEDLTINAYICENIPYGVQTYSLQDLLTIAACSVHDSSKGYLRFKISWALD
jgi:hypothetical protein